MAFTAFSEKPSEITGAEHLCKARAATPALGERWYKMWKAYQDDVIEAHKTSDLSDSQPTKGNIAGGLTTIEEKALGNLEKIGRECKFIDILACRPKRLTKGRGPLLHGHVLGSRRMRDPDGRGRLCRSTPSRRGRATSSAILSCPVIKITGNPKTMRTMPEHIDVDVSGVLRRAP